MRTSNTLTAAEFMQAPNLTRCKDKDNWTWLKISDDQYSGYGDTYGYDGTDYREIPAKQGPFTLIA